jgi:hypothetical protein
MALVFIGAPHYASRASVLPAPGIATEGQTSARLGCHGQGWTSTAADP